MINYPAIEPKTNSNRDVDSPAPPQKSSPGGNASFHELTTTSQRNNVNKSEVPDSQIEERILTDESDEEVVALSGDPVAVVEVTLPGNLLSIVKIPLESQLPAGSYKYESPIATSVEEALAVVSSEIEQATPRVKFSQTVDLREAIIKAATEPIDPKLAADDDLSSPTSPELPSIADADGGELMTNLVKSDLVYDAKIELSTNELGRIVTRQVSKSLIQEIPLGEMEGFKRITLKLHPAELGKLTLYVGWENETVKARIVATELATSELLNREKNLLLETMQAQGLNFESFDVSYEGSAQNWNSRETNRKFAVTDERPPVRVELATIVRSLGSQGSVINIIV